MAILPLISIRWLPLRNPNTHPPLLPPFKYMKAALSHMHAFIKIIHLYLTTLEQNQIVMIIIYCNFIKDVLY